jgi:hypothetical protein
MVARAGSEPATHGISVFGAGGTLDVAGGGAGVAGEEAGEGGGTSSN